MDGGEKGNNGRGAYPTQDTMVKQEEEADTGKIATELLEIWRNGT